MPRAERYARFTEADKAKRLERQRKRRTKKPSVNPVLREWLGDRDYLTVYNEWLTKQNGLCAICNKPPGSIRFHFDHNHQTGEMRGLLCFSCNHKLGFVEKYWTQIVRYLK